MRTALNILLVVGCCLLALPANLLAATVVDGVGRQVLVPDNPVRVISLAPNLTEIVYILGQEERLKGATQFSNYPEAAKGLPRVGSYVRLDLERIVDLRPDLCLASKDGNPKHIIDKITALGIPVYVVDPQDLTGIMDVLQRLGTLLGAANRASELVRDMQHRIGRINSIRSRTSSRPGVFFQIDEAPMVSVGSDTFIHELINLAGGRNLAAGQVSYPRYGWEKILLMQPEIVVITSMAGGLKPEQLTAAWQQWPQLPAVRDGRVYVVDANLFDRATPRLVRGLEVLAAIIHPEMFEAGSLEVEPINQ